MRRFTILTILCLMAMVATAQSVTNVRFEQEGKMVKIYYDLSEEADVSIYLSTDGGKTYETSPLRHLSGHAGEGVAAGISRCAVWDVLADREKLQGSNVCFKIIAARRIQNETFTVGGVSFTMVHVQGGTFTMGCTSEQENECYNDESPAYIVTLSDYYIGETEVTQALWQAVMGTTVRQQRDKGRGGKIIGEGDNYPMYYISWEECQEFCHKLSQLTGRFFRLPTEAEWEYAARGGNKSRGYKYSGSNDLSSVAWYREISGILTHPVKEKQPNELGLYDMSGNVEEWCQDWYEDYGNYLQTNPSGPTSGSKRVCRGGSCLHHPRECRVAFRHGFSLPYKMLNLGFRLVLIP